MTTRGLTQKLLRCWWIASALAAPALLAYPPGGDAAGARVLAGLAVVNATVGFVGAAAVGRLDLLRDAVDRSAGG